MRHTHRRRHKKIVKSEQPLERELAEEKESTHTRTDGLVVLKASLDEKLVDRQTPERTLAKVPYQLNLESELTKEIVHRLSQCEDWHQIYDDEVLTNYAVHAPENIITLFDDLQVVKARKARVERSIHKKV